MNSSRRLVAVGALFVYASASAFATPQSAPAWGTTSESCEVISVWEMQTTSPDTPWVGDALYGTRYTTASGEFHGTLHVPNGAVLDSIELEGCDESTSDEIWAGLLKRTLNSPSSLVTVDSGTTAADGCSRWRQDLPAPETVDNQASDYTVYVSNTGFDGTGRMNSVRVYYHLQVSPAPGTATFGDVPTSHPFFQYVEALAASGITAGCGNGNFCPDQPLTRGQMAVFLAKALGLNWPTQSQTN